MGLGIISSGIISEKRQPTLRVKPRRSTGMEANSHKMGWKSCALVSLLWASTHLETLEEFKGARKKTRCDFPFVSGANDPSIDTLYFLLYLFS